MVGPERILSPCTKAVHGRTKRVIKEREKENTAIFVCGTSAVKSSKKRGRLKISKIAMTE